MIKTDNTLASYSAADVFPAKILLDTGLINKAVNEKKILLRHLQLYITNRCNLNCRFCSCSNRDKGLELSYEEIKVIMDKAKKVGCKSVTISGGGEPLMHERFDNIIEYIHSLDIDIGLVTNGILFYKIPQNILNMIKWIRISFDDDRDFSEEFQNILEDTVDLCDKVDWAFSYVILDNPNFEDMAKLIRFTNEHDFTHVRLVSNLLDLESSDMADVMLILRDMGVDDSKVIYQGRKQPVRGTKNCYISLLKTVVNPDGYLYACCGTQYALSSETRDMENKLRLGLAKDIDKIIENQEVFDGSICKYCYYEGYNYALSILLSDVQHKTFV